MNQPLRPTTICPTCEGSGYRRIVEGRKIKDSPCLACQRTGQVDARRVCPKCGHWRDMCRCNIGWGNVEVSKLGKETAVRQSTSGVKGVVWNAAHKTWSASVYCEGKTHFLGEFPEEMFDLAKAAREEAEVMSASQIPGLRKKYGQLRKERGGKVFANRNQPGENSKIELDAKAKGEIVITEPPNDGDSFTIDGTTYNFKKGDSDLDGLLATARELDAEYQKLQVATAEAEHEAVAAWNRYALALAKKMVAATS
jgi:hypothetical protein